MNLEKQILDLQQQAHRVIETSKIVQTWEKIGAQVNLVGSLKMGLLVKHKDIDLHIYTDELNPAAAFGVMQELARTCTVKRIEYADLSQAEDCCLEFHAWVEDEHKTTWQLDMINIKAGSTYDGYFEKVSEQILRQMTPEQKQIIWELKYQTPDTETINGIEYYKAVIQDGVKTYTEFLTWRKEHPFTGIIKW